MTINSDRVLAYLALHPEGQDDDQIGAALGIDRIQINAICRRLAASDAIRRGPSPTGGKILNQPPVAPGGATAIPAAHLSVGAVPRVRLVGPLIWLADTHAVSQFTYAGAAHLTEDEVKAAIKQTLEAEGWQTETRWGHAQGVDIEAVLGDERFVLEAKGEGISDQARGNYFDGALGELLRRMTSPDTRYGLALPAHARFMGLVSRLPLSIRQRLSLWFFFVRPATDGVEVGVFPPDGRSTLR